MFAPDVIREAAAGGTAGSAVRRRLITIVTIAAVTAYLAVWIVAITQIPPNGHGPSGSGPGDTQQYIRAANRLAADQPLYGHGGSTGPFYAIGDYLSPPLLAVMFRAVLLIPGNSAYVWWAVAILFEASALLALVMRVPLIASLAIAVLGLSIAMAMWQGNVDCLVLPGMLLTWYWLRERRDSKAAMLLGLLVSLKLTPLVFVWWLIVTGRWRAAALALATSVVLAIVAMVGSEPLIFYYFAGVTTANVTDPSSAFGSSGFAYAVGLPAFVVTWLPRLILLGGFAAIWIGRRRPGVAWAIGASMMWLASPVASIHTPALLLVGLAPLAWPMHDVEHPASSDTGSEAGSQLRAKRAEVVG
jgi:alpha-1,2-mannosyltransferase